MQLDRILVGQHSSAVITVSILDSLKKPLYNLMLQYIKKKKNEIFEV